MYKDLKNLRKCIICGKIRSRDELIRITKEYLSGDIVLQPSTKTFGRSAYVCNNSECKNQLLKKNRLSKVLKTDIDKKILDKIVEL